MALPSMFVNSLTNWNVGALKDELRRNNLDYIGEKLTLVKRLQDFYEQQFTSSEASLPAGTADTSAALSQASNSPPSLLSTAELLQHIPSEDTTVSPSAHNSATVDAPHVTQRHQQPPIIPDDGTSAAGVTWSNYSLVDGLQSPAAYDSTTHTTVSQPQPIVYSGTPAMTPTVSTSSSLNRYNVSSANGTLLPGIPNFNMNDATATMLQPGMETRSTLDNSTSPSVMSHPYQLPSHHFTNRYRTQLDSLSSPTDELGSLEIQLKILKTRDEIRHVQHRLSLPPEQLRRSELNYTNSSEVSQMLSLVKRSVDINGLPPAKPMVFSGNPLEYTQWRSSFDLLIDDKDLSAAQKFSYLQNFLSNKALQCIQGYIMFNTAEAYSEARKSLDERFGDAFTIADAFRDKLEAWSSISGSDGEGLREYADFLKQCKLAMTQIKELEKLDDPRELKHLIKCLPKHLISRWSRESGLRKLQNKTNPVFSEYADFVMKEALLACDTTTSFDALTSTKKDPVMKTKATAPRSTMTLATQVKSELPSENSTPRRCHHCKVTKSHDTAECMKVASMTYQNQQAFMKNEGLCFECLDKGHLKFQCPNEVICTYKNCGERHPNCTHRYRSFDRKANRQSQSDDKPKEDEMSTKTTTVIHKLDTQGTCHSSKKSNLTSMIVPVFVSSPEEPTREILTYALIDTMSDTSIILKEVCDSLSISRVRKKLRISTITTPQKIQWCDEISNLRVRGYDSLHSDVISVPTLYTQDAIPVNKDHIPSPETASSWNHLTHVHDKLAPVQDCEVGLIIGYNCSAASLPLTTINDYQDLTLPYAVETVLGWSIVGGQNQYTESHAAHRIRVKDVTKEDVLQCLEENLSVAHEKPPMSQNDLFFLKKMNESITQVGGHYTMPLPFKDRPSLPDNRPYAMRRFKGLESRLNSNLELNQKYREFMDEVISKGEAEEVKDKESSGWYIPHHGVFHPHKPGKLRVVFDCSASFKGYSLNKALVQGPDLNSSLAGLLCRFRKERVAVTCDIKKMFHQFRVSEEDRRYLRFLWFRKDTKEIIDYQMNVHLFGAASSPGCAIYGLQKVANDHATEFPLASSFVNENFYVDDGLASVAKASDAIQLMNDAKAMMAKGNLVLHKFLSNNDEVAQALGCDGPTTKLITGDQGVDRALGLHWDIRNDIFKFSEVPVKTCSRRGILSTVASVFDPLGFLTPFSLKGKLLLQALCYEQKGWDEPLGPEYETEWNCWTSSLTDLTDLQIYRCYLSPDMDQPYEVELHTFSDASTSAYGVCSYIRLVNRMSGAVSVSLVMGKSRVAPRKFVTIPRLELQAATLAVKVGDFLKNELKYQDMTSYYWTDSKAVLGYISNERKKFHVFVSNRVARIRDTTSAEHWRYVSSKENPADIASRGSEVKDIPSSWFKGPLFLLDSQFRPDQQPSNNGYPLNPEDPEIKKVFVFTTSTESAGEILNILEKRSSWTKIATVMSYILKFAYILKDRTRDLSPNGTLVFNYLIRLVQQQHYSDEIRHLLRKLLVPKSSSLYNLDVFLDEDRTLRVGGRLENSFASYDVRHPAVLPSKAPLTKAYARHKHQQVAHQGRTTTVNALRASGVHVVGNGARMISSIIFNCVKCKRLRGNPAGQKMADLPQQRTESAAPFTYTGMDVFGPFIVKDGRKECKRYALLFSCLASRAIHLETLDDMSTDCFINSLRNFLAIRGPVTVLYSDRGTNFIGARNEFQQSLTEMSDPAIRRFLDSRQCQFKFNVPAASHMGGSWERMIRTVRNVFKGILVERSTSRLDSSSLRTLLYECMYIVNSRPLSTQQLTSDTHLEPLPLTPNNLLTMKETTLVPPPGNFDEPDLYSRKRWRRIQYLTEQFWSRWKMEYLQNLQKRNKWTKSQPNLNPDDVILLVENDLPRSAWQLGRVLSVWKGQDGLVRKVKIKTGSGQTLERPVHKLILLVASPRN